MDQCDVLCIQESHLALHFVRAMLVAGSVSLPESANLLRSSAGKCNVLLSANGGVIWFRVRVKGTPAHSFVQSCARARGSALTAGGARTAPWCCGHRAGGSKLYQSELRALSRGARRRGSPRAGGLPARGTVGLPRKEPRPQHVWALGRLRRRLRCPGWEPAGDVYFRTCREKSSQDLTVTLPWSTMTLEG